MSGLVLLSVLTLVLSAAGSGQAAPPSPFASASGVCPDSDPLQLPTQQVAHPDVLLRVTSTGSGELRWPDIFGSDGTNSIAGADTTWDLFGSISAGETPSVVMLCSAPLSYTVDLLDVPTTPTSFSGSTTFGQNTYNGESATGSFVVFKAPARAQYVADVTLTQGGIRLTLDGVMSRTFASSGRFDLGTLAINAHGIRVNPLDGPQGRWTLSISALPVALSDLSISPSVARPGATLTARYAISGDTSISAQVVGPAGTVRTLAENLHVGAGSHTLTWDGLDSSGRAVRDGAYTLRLSSLDPAGNSASGQATVTLDGTPPAISLTAPKRRLRGLVVRVRDAVSGVRRVTLQLNGRTIARRSGGGVITYRPRRGWRRGIYRVTVRTTDVVGNSTTRSRSFRVR